MYDTESAAASVAPGEPRPIESASASTACQTNDSKFAYVLTAGLLGLGCLFFIAIALLLYSVFSVSTTQKYAQSDTYHTLHNPVRQRWGRMRWWRPGFRPRLPLSHPRPHCPGHAKLRTRLRVRVTPSSLAIQSVQPCHGL